MIDENDDEKTNDIIRRKQVDRQDGRTGKTDRPYFIELFGLLLGVQKGLKMGY